MLAIKHRAFVQQNNRIFMEKGQGFKISSLFPSSFQSRAAIEFSTAAIPEYIVNSDVLNQELRVLFENNHLYFVHSAVFSRGNKTVTITDHPLHHALNEEVKPILSNNAVAKYITNIENMWKGRALFNKLLTKLLDVLLKIHLALINSKNGKKKEQRQRRIPEEQWGCLDIKDKWLSRKNCCAARINSFKLAMDNITKDKKVLGDTNEKKICLDITTPDLNNLPDDVQLQEEDALGDITGDISRRRLDQLKDIIKNITYKIHDQTFTVDHFLQVDQNSTIQKVQVCLPTTAIIAPYLPSKKNHLFIGYQLTFVLFANDVLKYAGYSKFCRSYCPLPSPTDLPALNIDSTYLYSIFFSRARDTSITLFDFEGFPIVSELKARTRKDAVFHAFFDLVQIRKVSSQFDYWEKKRVAPLRESVNQPKSSNWKDLPLDIIKELQKKSDEVIQTEIYDIEQSINALVTEFKRQKTQNRAKDFSKLISAYKSQWWKQELHGRNTTVCITNEYKTSQTCVYCFSPIVHPPQRLVIKNKEVLKEFSGASQCINPACVSVVSQEIVYYPWPLDFQDCQLYYIRKRFRCLPLRSSVNLILISLLYSSVKSSWLHIVYVFNLSIL
ncbi:hypothetical protein K501DRAFT_280152 [Backusella circina FSU 941]|nr:hypothetical protein K501DRAFT_280152 [Backusella circina FSU 941]